MRKKTVAFCLEKLMWYIIYLFPILLVLLSAVNTPLADLIDTINNSAFVSNFATTDVFTSLESIFGSSGLVPLLTGTTGNLILAYATYFVIVLIVHLAVDFLLFIPRYAHKCFDKVLGGSKNEE